MAKCIACLKELTPAMLGDDPEGPGPFSEATIFTSSGNYGSTVFDPMDSSMFLEVNICDECLLRNAHAVKTVRKATSTKYDYSPWNPQEDY